KAAISRLLQRRQQALALAETDSEARALAVQLQQTRRQLAQRLLAPGDGKKTTAERIRQLTQHKEDLERQLADRLPTVRRQRELDSLGPDSLIKLLPPQTALIDLFRYWDFQQDPNKPGRAGETWVAHYAAFLLIPGRPVQRVELG